MPGTIEADLNICLGFSRNRSTFDVPKHTVTSELLLHQDIRVEKACHASVDGEPGNPADDCQARRDLSPWEWAGTNTCCVLRTIRTIASGFYVQTKGLVRGPWPARTLRSSGSEAVHSGSVPFESVSSSIPRLSERIEWCSRFPRESTPPPARGPAGRWSTLGPGTGLQEAAEFVQPSVGKPGWSLRTLAVTPRGAAVLPAKLPTSRHPPRHAQSACDGGLGNGATERAVALVPSVPKEGNLPPRGRPRLPRRVMEGSRFPR